jgi:hypothetical protein
VPGEVTTIEPTTGDGPGLTVTCGRSTEGPLRPDDTFAVDFVIECTGIAHRWDHNPVVADVGRLADGPAVTDGHLVVDRSFAVAGTRQPATGGAVYGSGGELEDGPLGPRDSFWGMTFAAHRIADDLADRGLCRPLGPVRSVTAWLRWVRGRPA